VAAGVPVASLIMSLRSQTLDWEEEIDLRAYVIALLKYRYWIAGLAILAAALAFAISALISPTFEAVVLIAVVKPRYELQFDARFTPVNETVIPYKAYPQLAMSDETVAALIEEMGSALPEQARSISDLRQMLRAINGADQSMIQLSVRSGDPALATEIANHWAALLVAQANDLYGQSKEETLYFESRLAEAQNALDQADQDMIDFEARNEGTVVSAQLSSKQAALSGYLSAQRSLQLILQDAQSLQERLRSQDMANPTSFSDELTLLLLEIDALNRGTIPLQFQVSNQPSWSDKTVGDQIAFIDSLIRVLENKDVTLAQEAKALEPDILALQEKLQRIQTERERLQRNKDMASENLVSLARKVTETQLSSENTVGSVRLASAAHVPERPVAPRKLFNTAIAGAAGFLIAVLCVLALEYWRQSQPKTG
jgi:uncharacterized protein involved in exopolysaccharide biosynthesis